MNVTSTIGYYYVSVSHASGLEPPRVKLLLEHFLEVDITDAVLPDHHTCSRENLNLTITC